MNKYKTYCTPEQTKKALELGAPIIKERVGKCITEGLARLGCSDEENEYDYLIPGTDEMLGWLRNDVGLRFKIDEVSDTIVAYKATYGYWYKSGQSSNPKGAVLAVIDVALEYLIINKKRKFKMKKTLTIELEVEEGYELQFDPETRTIKEIPERSRSWEDFCKKHTNVKGEWYITGSGFVGSITSSDQKRCNNNLETRGDAEGILALIQLTRLHDEWETGKTPICRVSNTDSGFMVTDSKTGLLVFSSTERASEFIKDFKDLLEKAKRFL